MSVGFSIEITSNNEPVNYSVHSVGSCRYIVGTIPISDMAALVKGKRGYVMDSVLAKHYGASVFFGPAKEVAQRREQVEASRKEGLRLSIEAGEDPSLAWFKYGEVGASSSFMCKVLSGMPYSDTEARTPADYDDFQRCEKMLEIVSHLRERLPLLSVFKGYAGLVEAWDRLAALHRSYLLNKSGKPSKEEWLIFQDLLTKATTQS